MIRTWNRSHLIFDRNSSGLPVGAVLGVLAGHLHVAAERQRADAVLGVAAAEADDRGVEAELKLQHPDADPLGGEKMPELVHEHEHAQHEHEREKCRHQLRLHTSDFTSDFRFYLRGPSPENSSRAQRSTLRTSASVSTCDRLMRVHRPLDQRRDRRERAAVPRGTARPRLRWPRSARPAGCGRPRARDTPAPGTETPPCRARSNSSRPTRARSSDGSGAGQRSGYENAY